MELVRSSKLWATFLKNNGYILHDCIGSGSFGDVFEVTKLKSGARLAMKRVVVRRKITDDKYVMAEIEALMELDHENIIGLEGIILCDTLACIVLELAPQGNLEVMVIHTKLQINANFIKIAFRQLISAVEFCHNLELAHRDINPSNVLIFTNTLIKLADFGLCVRCIDAITGQPVLCSDYLGQESYLAPEVKRHLPFAPKPADVWGLGCILFFLLNCVNPPANENQFTALLSDSTTNKPLPSCGLEVSLQDALLIQMRRMCALNGAERPKVSDIILPWDYPG